jgi:hypothetical protein
VAIIVFGIALLIGVFWLWINRDKPVIVRFGGSDVLDHHGHELLNPFRDRAPEKAANQFLQGLQNQCSVTLAAISDAPERLTYTCGAENMHPLVGWHVTGRKELAPNRVLIRYAVSRRKNKNESETITDPFWIWVARAGQGWRADAYQGWY